MTFVMLLIFAAGFAGACYWYKQENERLIREWKSEMDPLVAGKLERFVWIRSFQALGILGVSLIIILVYNWRLDVERSAPVEREQAQNSAELPRPHMQNPGFHPGPGTIPQPNTNNNANMVRPFRTAFPPNNIVAPNGSVPTAPAANPPASHPTVADVYNPETHNTDAQSKMDVIKKRYSDILVTYMFLKKCATVGPDDYHVILSALGQEMASVNAPGRMQYDIITSAQGSFQEMYANTVCDTASIGTLQAQYNSYIAALAKEFSH